MSSCVSLFQNKLELFSRPQKKETEKYIEASFIGFYIVLLIIQSVPYVQVLRKRRPPEDINFSKLQSEKLSVLYLNPKKWTQSSQSLVIVQNDSNISRNRKSLSTNTEVARNYYRSTRNDIFNSSNHFEIV